VGGRIARDERGRDEIMKATSGDLRETKVCAWIICKDGAEGAPQQGKLEEIPGKWLERGIGCQ
jgi:hypothetical protein